MKELWRREIETPDRKQEFANLEGMSCVWPFTDLEKFEEMP